MLTAAEDTAALLAALEIPAAPVVRQVPGQCYGQELALRNPELVAAWLLAVRNQETKAVG